MNRHQRRALERAAAAMRPASLAHPAPDSVSLAGGPMDGWSVKPDAPALRPDWYRTWPPTVAARFAPGHYAIATEGQAQRATWQANA